MANNSGVLDRAAAEASAGEMGAQARKVVSRVVHNGRFTEEDVNLLKAMKIANPNEELAVEKAITSAVVQDGLGTLADPEKLSAVQKLDQNSLMPWLWQAQMTGMFATGAGAVAKKLGPTMGKPFELLHKGLHATDEFLTKKTMGDFAHDTVRAAGTVKDKAARLVGSKSAAAGGESTVGGGVATAVAESSKDAATGLRETMERHLEKAGGHIDRALEAHPTATAPMRGAIKGLNRFHNWGAERHAAKAARTHVKAHEHIDTAIKALEGEEFTAARGVLKNAKADFEIRHTVEGIELDAGKKAPLTQLIDEKAKAQIKTLEGHKEAFKKTRAALLKPIHDKYDELAKGASRWEKLKLWKQRRSEISAADAPLAAAEKSLGKFEKELTHGHTYLASQAAKLESVTLKGSFAEGLKGIPGKLSKLPVGKSLEYGLYGVSQVATAVTTEKLVTNKLATLKHMAAAIEGKKVSEISTAHIMFGKVPKIMEAARHDYMMSVGPQAAANAIGMVAFHRLMKTNLRGSAMLMGMGVQLAAGMAGGMVADRHKMLDTYSALVRAKAAGKKLDAGAYAALGMYASGDIAKMEQGDKSLVAVTKQYEEKQATPGQFLKDIGDGTVARLLKEAAAAPKELPAEEQARLKSEIATESPKLSVGAGEMAHIDRRADAANAKLDQAAAAEPVAVGNFTSKIAAEKRTAPRAIMPSANHVDALQNEATAGIAGRA